MLPNINDVDKDKWTMSANLGQAEEFIVLYKDRINIKPGKYDKGSFEISIQIEDDNQFPKMSFYLITIHVIPANSQGGLKSPFEGVLVREDPGPFAPVEERKRYFQMLAEYQEFGA